MREAGSSAEPDRQTSTAQILGDLQGRTAAGSPILVFGDDGSESSDVAWLWVNEHAWPGWRFAVVTVRFDPAQYAPLPPERASLHEWQPPRARRLLAAADGVAAGPLAQLTSEVDPRLVLGRLHPARLLVIGHRGTGAAKALGIGSTADWLLHRPPTALAIIRTARPVQRVLVCTDGSPDARAATLALAGMPWITGRRVTVLGVADAGARPEPAIEGATATLRRAGAVVEPLQREALGRTRSSRVREVIHEVLDQSDPDLVVLGTRGIGLGQRLLRGSVAADVVHRARCSVLLGHVEDEATSPPG